MCGTGEAALLGGDRGRIVLGGSSQGGSLALHAASAYRYPLCALISLRSMVMEQYTTVHEGKQSATPIYVFAGGRDTLCPLEALAAVPSTTTLSLTPQSSP